MQIEIPNVDLTTVETGIPILTEGVYTVKVAKTEVKPTRDGTGQLLSLEMQLEEKALTREGEPVGPGFPIFDRVSLKVTEKYNPAKRLASIMDCFLSERTAKLNTEDLVGQVGEVKLRIREDEDFGASNEVKSYIKK